MTEVCNSQGDVFPYTKGLWLVSNLIAAINTNDLDAMDESVPFIYDRFLNENCHAFRIVEQNGHNSGKDKCIIS